MEDVILEPPLYFAPDHIFDVCFHPKKDLIISSLITGQIQILSYNSEDVQQVVSLDHHKESCRMSTFSEDGTIMGTVSKDKSIGIINQDGQLALHIKNAHKEPINHISFLSQTIVATGDDSGKVKIWDLQNPKSPIYEVKEQEEQINGILFSRENYMLTCSQDGTLGAFDLRKTNASDKKLYALSDNMDEDLNSMCMIKYDKFVASCSSEGNILLFKWDWFGDCKDRITGHPNSVECMLKVDENTLITGAEDGFVRGISVYPNQITDILGQHEEDEQFPVQKISMSHCKNFLASCSHDNSIKFYDISKFVNRRQNTKFEEYQDSSESEGEMQQEEEQKKSQNGTRRPKKKNQEQNQKNNENQFQQQEQQEDNNENQEQEEDYEDDDDDDDDDDSDDEMGKGKKKRKSLKQKKNQSAQAQKRAQQKNQRLQFFGDMK